MKTCSKCNESKPGGAFTKKRGGLNAACRECTRVASKEHYKRNKRYYKEKKLRREKELRKFISGLKDQPCADCGERYPYYVMDFDHRDPSKKSCNVSSMAKLGSKRRILEEAAKCDLVCANCHRVRTYMAS